MVHSLPSSLCILSNTYNMSWMQHFKTMQMLIVVCSFGLTNVQQLAQIEPNDPKEAENI